jgi:MFS family permease
MDDAKNRRHISVFALVTALCLMGDSMLYTVLPVYFQQAGLTSLWEVGVVLSVNRLVRLPLNPFIGRLYSRISERTGVCIAVLLGILTTLSYGFLQGLVWWVLARCVWGLAWSLLRIGSLFCILKISTPTTRGLYNGLYNGLYRLGSLVGMLGGGVLADMVDLRFCAVVFSLGTACALPALLAISRTEGGVEAMPEDTGVLAGLRLAASARNTLLTVLCGAAVTLVLQGVVASTLSRLIAVHTDGGVCIAGFMLGAATLAGMLQALRWGCEPWLAPLTGKLADTRYGWQLLFLYAFGCGAIIFALLALPLPLPLWFACLLGMQATATALTTLADTGAANASAETGGRSLLMAYALLTDMGAAFGPLLAYSLNALFGINTVYALCAGLFVTLFVLWKPFAGR